MVIPVGDFEALEHVDNLIVIISSKYEAGIRIHCKYEEAVLINHNMDRRK
jgi:hypothetical protein